MNRLSDLKSVHFWSALALIGGFVIALLTFLRGCDGDENGAASTVTSMVTVTATAAPVSPRVTPSPSASPSPVPPIPTRVDAISIETAALQGRKVGPNMFAFQGNLDFGLGYGWTATAGGVKVSGEGCQIKMQVTGPQSFPAQRTAECSRRIGSPFNGGINSERITTPGEYTITVTDELTATTGVATFTLIR